MRDARRSVTKPFLLWPVCSFIFITSDFGPMEASNNYYQSLKN